jgi:acetoin utilization protein AcuC
VQRDFFVAHSVHLFYNQPMFRNLRLKREDPPAAPSPEEVSIQQLIGDSTHSISLRVLNNLPANAKQRIYRTLIPPELLTRFNINPLSWKQPEGDERVKLVAESGSGEVHISVRDAADSGDPFFCIELAENTLRGIDLNLLLLNDPHSPRFTTDVDEQGRDTHFGTTARNVAEEEKAMRAGLAPGQFRSSLSASKIAMQQLDTFLAFLAHHTIFLEPLTYASAWVFERRGFAYVRGHKLMDTIQAEFQQGGRLCQALDGSTPFRQPDQWRTIRGRAWAIQDGLLETIDAQWTGLRMVKQVGRHAGVETAPGITY